MRRLAPLLLLLLVVSACSSAPPAARFDTASPGLSEDQRIVRSYAQTVAPAASEGLLAGAGQYAGPILAAVGCGLGVALGEGAGGCVLGAGVGFVGGELLRMSVLEQRGRYGDDAAYVEAVSTELQAEVSRLTPVAEAASRLAEAHVATLQAEAAEHAAGRLAAPAWRSRLAPIETDREALRLISTANQTLLDRIDSALTGATAATSEHERLEELELTFLGATGRVDGALAELDAALAALPAGVRE